jgi:hypothetical protein
MNPPDAQSKRLTDKMFNAGILIHRLLIIFRSLWLRPISTAIVNLPEYPNKEEWLEHSWRLHEWRTGLVGGSMGLKKPPRPKLITKRVWVEISVHFRLVFITVTIITVACGICSMVLAAIWTLPTPNQQSAFEAMGFAWKAGIGAIFGLLGGKAA